MIIITLTSNITPWKILVVNNHKIATEKMETLQNVIFKPILLFQTNFNYIDLLC